MDKGIINNGIQMPVQLQKVNEPVNWQKVRIQASIAAMQAHISDGEHMALLSRNLKHDDEAVSMAIAKAAVMYADALIEELQKKGGEQ